MIVEDAHWVDPTSLEVFGRTVDQIKTVPVLLIVTFRPEFTAPWAGQSHVTSITLNRLGEREAAAIVGRLAGNTELPGGQALGCVGFDRNDPRREPWTGKGPARRIGELFQCASKDDVRHSLDRRPE